MNERLPARPKDRRGFKIGIICALSVEADMVERILDRDWTNEGSGYGKAEGDINTYTCGVIGTKNVVLAYCATMGSNNAAQVAMGLRSSFTQVKVVFLVGVCGVAPYTEQGKEIILGDCVVSTAVVQFDLGRQGPRGFKPKEGLNALGRAGIEAGSLLTKLTTTTSRARLNTNLKTHINKLRMSPTSTHPIMTIDIPDNKEDRLYDSSYVHSHRPKRKRCHDCDHITGLCGKSCAELGCQAEQLVPRKRLETESEPTMHFGIFGSSNSVMKSGLHRDRLAKDKKIIAFEMEGSGVWEVYPTVIIIKAACDYADSHKDKTWQPYAAAVAAAGLKSFLPELEFPDEPSSPTKSTNRLLHGITLDNGVQHYHYESAVSKNASQEGQSTLDEVMRNIDDAIQNYYNSSERLKIERLSGETLSLEQCYINLALKEVAKEKQVKQETSPFSLQARLRLDANIIGDTIALSELFNSRKLSNGGTIEPRRILIRGRAGIGKTTLCKKIVHEFLHRRLGGKLFDRLLWLPLRRVRGTNAKYSWRELLQETFPSPPIIHGGDWEELITTMSERMASPDIQNKTLFLLDGLDEVSQEWSSHDGAYHFLQSLICDAPNVIITSRPQASGLRIGSFDMELETTGFTIEQINTYMQNSVQDEQTLASMKHLLNTKPLLQSLLRIPVQLDAFCCTWESENDTVDRNIQDNNFNTMTNLYIAISDELCRKDLARLQEHNRSQSLKSYAVRELLAEELQFLEVLAFQGMVNNIIDFTPRQQETIDSHFRQSGTTLRQSYSNKVEQLSFLRTSDVLLHKNRRNYHFLHLTYQEFFAAKCFVRHWRRDTDLVLLSIGSKTDADERQMAPSTFLQKEKYNPRFNIFWRFVTGLVQIRWEQMESDVNINSLVKQKDILVFFQDLNNQPVDLLEAGHRRLLTYCLSEVVVGKSRKIREMCLKEQDALQMWMTAKLGRSDAITLAREIEFPEHILCKLLQTMDERLYKKILSIFGERVFVSTQALHIISGYLAQQFSKEIQLQAIQVIFRSSRNSSEDVVAQAVKAYSTISKDSDPSVRSSAAKLLRWLDLKSHGATDIMVELVQDREGDVSRVAAVTLGERSSVSAEVISILTQLLQNEESGVLWGASAALRFQTSLPPETVTILTGLLKNKNTNVRRGAAIALSRQSSVPMEVFSVLIELLQDGDSNVRQDVTMILIHRLPIPAQAITSFIELLKSKDTSSAWVAARQLGWQSSLPPEAITSLMELLKVGSIHGLRFAQALSNQSSLPSEAITILFELLQDRDSSVRVRAALTLCEQSSIPSMSAEFISVMVELLKDERHHVRFRSTCALIQRSSLPAELITSLISRLKDEDVDIRRVAARALRKQSSLPPEAITNLIGMLKHTDHDGEREEAAETLKQQSSLSAEAITALIDVLKHENNASFAYNVLQQRSLFYSTIEDLDFQTWKYLWRYWANQASHQDFCCYIMNDCLWLWSNGDQCQITTGYSSTQRLLKVNASEELEL